MKLTAAKMSANLWQHRSAICNMTIFGGISLLSASIVSCPAAHAAVLYEADYYTNTINQIDTITKKVTPFSTGSDGLNGPIAIAFDSHGVMYETDYRSRGINKISADGRTVTPFVTGFDILYGLAFDKNDNLFVTDSAVLVGIKDLGNSLPHTGKIKKITPDKQITTLTENLSFPLWLTFDSNGRLFESEHEGDSINQIDLETGKATLFAEGIIGPLSLVFDANNNLFAAEEDSTTIKQISSVGKVTSFATGLDGAFGLVIDENGDFFESDSNTNTINKISADGKTITPWVTTGLNRPYGLAFAPKLSRGVSDAASVPEPFTIVGTLIGGTAALRMRKKLKDGNKA